jgi:murein DD-endopeptidase MepM/ murein hydrolase activator NlpD
VLISPARVGFLAIGLAVAGVVQLGSGGVALQAVDIQLFTSQANVLNGSGAIQTVGYRTAQPSRSTDRTTLADATDQELQAAAEQQAQARTEAISSMTKTAAKFAQRVAENAWQLPVAAGDYVLTARFGDYGIWAGMHTGLDFAAPEGTPIHAVANGTITFVGWDGAYGNKTIETLPNGTEIWYCHQSAQSVKVGDTVLAGQPIGNIGSTGHTTGPHLHLEVRPGGGDPVDPYQALIFHGVQP